MTPERFARRRATMVRLSRAGPPPSYRELRDAGGASSTGVASRDLDWLEAAGYVRRAPFRSRAVVPVVRFV